MASSVTRAMRILDLLSRSEKPLTLSKVAGELGIPKSTAHGILRDLADEAFVSLIEPASYTVGLKAFEVGAAHLRTTGTVGVVGPELVRLTGALHATSHYAVLNGADAVYLCKEDPPGAGIQLASALGARLPSHTTAVGKCCLAWLDDGRVAAHVDAPAGLSDGLLDELAAVRSDGYAVDDGAVATGVRCVAAPVFDVAGPCGAVGVSYLRGGPDVDVAAAVRTTAERVTAHLGGRTLR